MILRRHITHAWTVLRKTGHTFFQDNGFFLATGLAFNLLLYFLPLIMLMISVLAYTVLESERAMVEVQSVVRQFLPHSEQAFADNLKAIISNRGLLGLVGFFFFLIFSSTLYFSRHRTRLYNDAHHGASIGLGHNRRLFIGARACFWRGTAADDDTGS
jgi:uncharacterized BrkB/YihY/UPF0761 family membrane protein